MNRASSTCLIAAIAGLLLINFAAGQRRVTPVNSSDELKIVSKEELKKIKEQTAARMLLTDSVTLDSLRRDSIDRASKKVFRPTLMSAAAGINFWDPLMRAFGQDYGGADIWFALNLKNRFIPVAELGFGQANSTPDDGNFTYKSETAFYGKLGMNYNFMASKDPRYQLYAGVRLAATSFNFDVLDATVSNGYWSSTSSKFNLADQHSSAFWGEFLVGIQVELFRNVSLGWAIRYNFPFSIKDTPNARPWYIPGYGTRDNKLHVSLSVAYTLPLHKEKQKQEIPTPPTIDASRSDTIPDREQRVSPPLPGEHPVDTIP